METLFRTGAGFVALAAELCSVACIVFGMVETLARTGVVLTSGRFAQRPARRSVFVGFAVWIVLALEFALAADIVRTAIAPSWDDIGRLAAIAVIRAALNYFLDSDLAEYSAEDTESSAGT